MKTLYIDCGMGAAGDMLTAALLECVPDKDEFLAMLNSLGIPGVTFLSEPSTKCGIKGTHITVLVNGEEESEQMHPHPYEHGHMHEHEHTHISETENGEQMHPHPHEHGHTHISETESGEQMHPHPHEYGHTYDHGHTHISETENGEQMHPHPHEHGHTHHHSGMSEIKHIVEKLPVSEKVKDDILAVYSLIAEAESRAHGVPIEQIHFHEVGTMDAVADVTAVCMLMERLNVEQVVVSPIHVGSGHVRCAHGILPVPAPATAYILRDVPIYGGKVQSELCTPTGAALLKHFASRFSDMPIMKTAAIGYGMGKKDFDFANCVRVLLGETQDFADTVAELCCNIDDMTAEAIGFAKEQFFAAGALDVYTVSAQMKKSRPGVVLHVMCRESDKDDMIKLIFRHTTTLGVRENISRRYTLSRTTQTVETEFGKVRKKVSAGYGITKEKYEYEDIARIARQQNISLVDAAESIRKADN